LNKKYNHKSFNLIDGVKEYKFSVFFVLLWFLRKQLMHKTRYFLLKYILKYGFKKIGKGVVFHDIPVFLYPAQNIILKDKVHIERLCVFQAVPSSFIVMGKNSSLNIGCILVSLFGITIGDNTRIGEYVSIRDNNHKYDNKNMLICSQGMVGKEIIIGNNVWIGRGCIILPGVLIGDGAIVAANSVVNKDIEPNTINGGVPCRFIKNR
jgi:acetyltransferase-like isoleucine patch superfamily enzyme